ncbi:GuaB3 family IMP dehydrogenase-related protein [Ornithinimicrobium faecis]|uniref:GuaB3 family IMP dehydrogenase-related protein n=1 Tax=Ornithinimicrobium faecis TaxID=2934158 RepID=A0ABY4YQH7_9MICO|nr:MULTISPECIES: GuaB3 family IMP dehydrogenase-related protein [unclassified Ornithinimicrobium]USQ78816.1 GuaB3 family IMP dehydrogenase-related protein [Ornithinimicrobium sp. HY1793]
MSEIEIGRGKRGRRAYSFEDIAVVPSRRTRDPEDVSIGWQIDAYHFELPVIAAPMDSVVSPQTAIAMGQLGGLGVLDLEGLWTRYDDPTPYLEEIADLEMAASTARLRELYAAPIRPDLITQRLKEIRDAGVTVAGSLSPQRTQQFWRTVVDAGVDLFVIRGTTVSAEHVSSNTEPLNLKRFIYELDVPVVVGGAGTYTAALHLMRTGAAGVLVGFGGGATHTTRTTLGIHAPMATAIADVAAARRDYLDESGGRYVHVIADGGMGQSGDIVKAVACGADAVMIGAALARAEQAPGRGFHWGSEAHHPFLPRGERVKVGTVGTLEEILNGPGRDASGTTNLMGALRRAMATTGYTDVKEFQRVEVVVAPYAPR